MVTETEISQNQEEIWWQACASRDVNYNNQFVIAVKTTKIYCRPTCPAKPLRKNIEFFLTPEEAERNGYRACKRCEPKEIFTSREKLVLDTFDYLATHPNDNLEEIANALFISPFHLQRTFKNIVGVSPKHFAKVLMIQEFMSELQNGTTAWQAILRSKSNANGLTRQFKHLTGLTAAQVKQGNVKVQIAYAIAPSRFGLILIAGTETGIAAIYLGDNESELIKCLNGDYPMAIISYEPSDQLTSWANIVKKGLEDHQFMHELHRLPIDVQGTAFQAKVWKALKDLPVGETRSYQELAEQIGAPKSARAVASACARNKVAIVIPCHRIIHGDGNVSGYRWGVDRKRMLLDHEKS